jgi:hypothetical protein
MAAPFSGQNRLVREQLFPTSTAAVLFCDGLRVVADVAATGTGGTELAKAQCSTIRLKLLKIGALIRITVRKVWVSLAGGYPYVTLFRQVYEKLCAMPLKCWKRKIPTNFSLANVDRLERRARKAPRTEENSPAK